MVISDCCDIAANVASLEATLDHAFLLSITLWLPAISSFLASKQ